MNMPTQGRILRDLTVPATPATSVSKEKREFFPIALETWPAEYQQAYAEYRQIVEMWKQSAAKIDELFLPALTRLDPPPAGKQIVMALRYGKCQYEVVDAGKAKNSTVEKPKGLTFQASK